MRQITRMRNTVRAESRRGRYLNDAQIHENSALSFLQTARIVGAWHFLTSLLDKNTTARASSVASSCRLAEFRTAIYSPALYDLSKLACLVEAAAFDGPEFSI